MEKSTAEKRVIKRLNTLLVMANNLYKVTTKRSQTRNGEHIAKDMEVEIVTTNSSRPLATQENREKIVQAFKTKYGIDMKKANALSVTDLDIEQIS